LIREEEKLGRFRRQYVRERKVKRFYGTEELQQLWESA
jgi:hypothetical protein